MDFQPEYAKDSIGLWADSKTIFIAMLHLYGTHRGKNTSENNFRICVKGQQMQFFIVKGVGRGKKQKSEQSSWGINVYKSDLMPAWHKNTKLNTQE